MSRRLIACLASVIVLAVACSNDSGSDSLVETSAASVAASPVVLPTPTALETTAPFVEPPPAAPTAIDLRSGTGLQAVRPETDADGDVEPDESGDDQQQLAFVDEPTPTPTVETPAVDDGVPATSAEATPTAVAAESSDRVSLTRDPVTGALLPTPTPETAAPNLFPALVTPADGSSSEVAVANGGEVYGVNCARCHGENGNGTFQASGLWSISARYTSATMITELTSGHPVTFGFGDKLSAREISDVVAYVLAEFG